MTNPGNIVRVRARRGGRASVYEANAICQAFSSGLLAGRGAVQNTVANMNVLVGGSPDNPDVVIATTPSGYKVALDLVGQQPLQITKPAANSRISQIIAYTNDLSLTTDETATTGSPATCGLIVVNSATSSNPVAPTDAEIRSAITADGGTGAQAAYGIIASITVPSTATAISNNMIVNRNAALLGAKVTDSSITTNKINNLAVTGAKIADSTIGASKLSNATTGTDAIAPANKNVIRIAGRKIMFGKDRLMNIPSEQETERTITFPESFPSNVTPAVVATVESWEAKGTVEISDVTNANFNVVVRHELGSASNPLIGWNAIG